MSDNELSSILSSSQAPSGLLPTNVVAKTAFYTLLSSASAQYCDILDKVRLYDFTSLLNLVSEVPTVLIIDLGDLKERNIVIVTFA